MRYLLLFFFSLSGLAVHATDAPCKFEVNLVGEDIKCHGDLSGKVTVNIDPVNGYSGPYVIRWFDDDDRSFRDDLPAGTHFVKVTDALGCFLNEFITLEEPEVLAVEMIKEDALCFEDPSGSIVLAPSGGVAPYTYEWSNGEISKDISQLTAGNYSVNVIDANFCSVAGQITIDEPEALSINSTVLATSCVNSADGIIKIVVFGGVIPYSYSWNTGDEIPNITDLTSGGYTLTVTDGNLCTTTETYDVPEPPPLQIAFEVDEVSCYQESDGSITAFVSGGTPGYRYLWSNTQFVLGDTTMTPSRLKSDYYKLQITDFNGCVKIDSVQLREPQPFVLNLSATPASCFDKPDGNIDLTVSGGRAPYDILWSTGSNSEDLDNLLSGTYSVVVADQTGCGQYGQVLVDQPDSLDFNFTLFDVSCKDQTDGSISLDPMGGTPPYFVSWSNGSSDFDIDELPGSTYAVELVDDQNCSYIGNFDIEINPQACITFLTIPSAFTPNGDGFNDTWIIENQDVYPALHIEIYSKWGNRVFRSDGYNEPWNGTQNSREVPAGTYYYIIDLGNGDPAVSGHVTLAR